MLEIAAAISLGLFANVIGQPTEQPEVKLLSWQDTQFFQLPDEPDPVAERVVGQYLNDLAAMGYNADLQGVWLQSDLTRLATHQGQKLHSAASLTKMATTLVALKKWGADYQFETRFYAKGEIEGGVLRGDLVVTGSGDPAFVWEEAIAVGNVLNEIGIRKVTGNLVISNNFYMNFYPNPAVAAEKLKEALNSKQWSSEARVQHAKMPPGTGSPVVEIGGGIQINNDRPDSLLPLLQHRSPPMSQIIKQMNIYSNNMIAEVLAQLAGGGDAIAQIAAETAGVPREEIQLINGSGLGVANRMSPRMATAIAIAIDRLLQGQSLGIADLFPVAGRDKLGTMLDRRLPPNTAIKTGTLAQVSALSGILPTQKYGWVWFAILNEGGNISALRVEQDRVLQRLSQEWGVDSLPPSAVPDVQWGDPQRIFRAL
ncbi:MAG: D-alanyl-D-alanine carboxypeptidase [Cyanobacteriota bacterium]|nr:D-alanyl-D-alanine carboxypeptidase [Cyanobacteriota bacterium]